MKRFAFLLILFIVGCTTTIDQEFNVKQIESKILSKVNELRQENGLAALSLNPSYSIVARTHSQDMVSRNYLAHENPEGEQAWDRVKNAEIEYGLTLSENLHEEKRLAGTLPEEIANSTVESWLTSTAGHKENLLEKQWSMTGLGIAVGEKDANNRYRIVVTQIYSSSEEKIERTISLPSEIKEIELQMTDLDKKIKGTSSVSEGNNYRSQYNSLNEERTSLINDYNALVKESEEIKSRIKN